MRYSRVVYRIMFAKNPYLLLVEVVVDGTGYANLERALGN
jgi:hypothetical protein